MPPTQKQRKLAEEMLDLCEQTFPKMFKDMVRITLMKPFDYDYYSEEFKVIAEEYDYIFLLNVLVSNPHLDWSYLKYYWKNLRNAVAKYIGNAKDPRIVAIDKHYCMLFWGLPKIVIRPRPTKPLPWDWWDFNPERDELIKTVAQNWWGIHQPLDLKFEDLDINNRRFEDMESIECLGSVAVVHSIDPILFNILISSEDVLAKIEFVGV